MVFCSKMTNFEIDWFWLQIVWQKSMAIALVFCSKMTKFEIDLVWLQIEKWWKWAMFGQTKAIALVFCSKNDQIWNWLILIADWKVMKMSDVWPKSKAIALVFCSKMTKFEIDWVLCRMKRDENERCLAKK